MNEKRRAVDRWAGFYDDVREASFAAYEAMASGRAWCQLADADHMTISCVGASRLDMDALTDGNVHQAICDAARSAFGKGVRVEFINVPEDAS